MPAITLLLTSSLPNVAGRSRYVRERAELVPSNQMHSTVLSAFLPNVQLFPDSIVASIRRCHRRDRGSIPRQEGFCARYPRVRKAFVPAMSLLGVLTPGPSHLAARLQERQRAAWRVERSPGILPIANSTSVLEP